jgi:hypothetical protein
MQYNAEGHDEYPQELYNEFQDKFVDRVKDKYTQRSHIGYNKYGTTLEREDIDLVGWLNHLQEELMDASLYIEKLKEELVK